MTSWEIREKYLKYFEKLGHKIIDPAPLVLVDDPTTLFTSAGMQPLVPYLKGKQHPGGKRLVDSQPSFRSQDIEEVGDNRHTTFFEMLGNWSLGDYFKKEQLAWFWEFLTEELELPKEKLHVSVFSGGNGVNRDTETEEVWKKLGVPENHIHFYGVDKNWWSRSGPPDKMPVGEIGGPDSEVFYDFGEVGQHERYSATTDRVTPCHPNCDCGRFLEIGNSVFIQYIKKEGGSLEELPQKNVDFGGGLERLVAATENEPDIFNIDLFLPIIREIESYSDKNYSDVENQPAMRVVADHLKASTFLIINSVVPSNKMQGYILRRLLRRAAIKMNKLGGGLTPEPAFEAIANTILDMYNTLYGVDRHSHRELVREIITTELKRFGQTLDKGLKEIKKITNIDGKVAFDLYQSYGFPLEITEELFREKGQEIDKEQFYSEFEKHKELSRTASSGMFKGGLAGDTPTQRKYHTTAHLLQAALKKYLGEEVKQAGQNITDERLRFDFNFNRALNDEEKNKIEDFINGKIAEGLPMVSRIMKKEEALKEGAIGLFTQKYGDEVSVYTIGDPQGEWVSKEFCGGPHVTNTSEIGHVTITKEESAGSGVRRIYAKIG